MDKATLRTTILAGRRAMDERQRAEAAEAIALHLLAHPLLASARRIAAHLSMPSEPGTGPLLAGLHERGTEVLVPISLPDGVLDWVLLDPDAERTATTLGIPEPAGERLGADALADVQLVVMPALAVDHAGHRLGRGAGYYDRALTGVRAPRCALVFTHELLPEVPHEPHDLPVQMAVTPGGVFRIL